MDNINDIEKASLVYVTCGSLAQAREIGRALVEERLAACANIIDGMKSIYRWEGQIEEGDEVLLLLKTHANLVEKLGQRVKDLHSFDSPCVVEIPLGGGNADYFVWIASEVSGEAV